MTNRQYRVVGNLFWGIGVAICTPFAWAELTGRPSPLPPFAMLVAILISMAGMVSLNVSRN
jgi:4-hydroxybenzoate polyprenyltransferase